MKNHRTSQDCKKSVKLCPESKFRNSLGFFFGKSVKVLRKVIEAKLNFHLPELCVPHESILVVNLGYQ